MMKKLLLPILAGTIGANLNYKILQSKQTKNPFEWDKTTHFASSFTIDGKRATKTQQSCFRQITAKHPLPQHSVTTFLLVNYSDVLAVGMLTASRKQEQFSGNNVQQHTQSVGFWSWPDQQQAQICIDGQQKVKNDIQLYIEQGESLEMQVDLSVPQIIFTNKKNNVSKSFTLAKHYQTQPIYIFANMRGQGACIQQSMALVNSKFNLKKTIDSQIQSCPFVWDTSSKYAYRFIIQGKKATTNLAGLYQITGLDPLPAQSTTTFRLVKYSGWAMAFGIITAKRKQQKWSGDFSDQHTQSIGYWSHSLAKKAKIFVDGQQKIDWDASLFIEEGDMLRMQVDRINAIITFYNQKNGTNRSFSLARHFQNDSVYAYVAMQDKGASVEIIE